MNLLVLNQYFPPDRAATAQLLGQWVEDLSSEMNITVVSGTPTYAPDRTLARPPLNIQHIQIPLLPFSRTNLMMRMLNYLFYFIGTLCIALCLNRKDYVICWTDPPLVGLIGAFISKLKKSKFIFVSQDVYPDVLIASKKLNFLPIRKCLNFLIHFIYQSADKIVVIGEDMKILLAKKGVPIYKLITIRNWQDTNRIQPVAPELFRNELKIPPSTFLVMHSGNIGHSQDFDSLMTAASRLENQSDIQFVIIGDGAKLKSLQKMRMPNVCFLPYQPESRLSESLSSADLHYVSLLPSFLGSIVPSKIYGILAAKRPMLIVAPDESDLATIAKESDSGFFCKADGDDVSKSILELKNNRGRLQEMGEHGFNWILKNGTREIAISKYRSLLQDL